MPNGYVACDEHRVYFTHIVTTVTLVHYRESLSPCCIQRCGHLGHPTADKENSQQTETLSTQQFDNLLA